MKKIAIIGAGLSGLTLADQIANFADVTLFEKDEQVSGRIATQTLSPYIFDHGAQFFTAHNPEFLDFIEHLKLLGVVAHWDARFVEVDSTKIIKSRIWEQSYPHYVGVPDMTSIGQFLFLKLSKKNVKIKLNTKVNVIEKDKFKWSLFDCGGVPLGCYDWVITAIPVEQTVALIPNDFEHKHLIENIQMVPCYSLMIGFNQSLNLSWDVAYVTNSILSWISINSSKPGRNDKFSLVAMSRNNWATDHFSHTEVWVIDQMIEALSGIISNQVLQPSLIKLHKWQFANSPKTKMNKVLLDKSLQLACCGDWCISGRVESAYLSAKRLGSKLILAI